MLLNGKGRNVSCEIVLYRLWMNLCGVFLGRLKIVNVLMCIGVCGVFMCVNI